MLVMTAIIVDYTFKVFLIFYILQAPPQTLRGPR